MPDKDGKSKTIIVADRIIDGLGGAADKESALVLEGDSIKGVIRKGEARAAANAQVLEYPGASVVPGLIDCHTHTNMPGNSRRGEDVNTHDDDELRLYTAPIETYVLPWRQASRPFVTMVRGMTWDSG